ncbi:ATP-dependent zinc metalloprotease FtsH [Synergistes jonesii]|uniref:ATP-dependent zinc metalloprotease FtsH n=1 Tax=Synergistes jonesii TaxID=2754 RepID=A0A073J188_9BACT|nr:ATP-dependent zinc metalloprotease FtsH [Synergistes jonesii]KEJ91452.1 cell division protein FtsH [Synergistes jonesii]OFB60509.1 cell division protein FtsH [Synergistes jonesii]OFB61519.1 cell division protein FtsH [Synergistes jonesii]OFB64489.1 cell division protein FtsH [Synergistes jonesii]OFB66687.1 cell division protein FtsH [Synergistes jonesii]
MKKISKNVGMYIVLIVLAVTLVNVFLAPEAKKTQGRELLSYSKFLSEVNAGSVAKVKIDHEELTGTLKDGGEFTTYILDASTLPAVIAEKGVEVEIVPPPKNSWITALLTSLLPTLLLIGVWIYFIYNMQGGGGKVMSFAKSKAKLFLDNRPKVTFADVAGCDEAKEELAEVVQFLKDPAKFTKVGAKVPRGVLLLGAPGTGKTLLSRAVAGEADVPFFSISGSDFVEMFVGVGAARVRDLFEQARKYQPCIIFIDEIDAVGRHRGAGLGGGHDEREQTLNQLLVEMDGFDAGAGIILIAATNRPDILDPALLRPGRFDRQVVVDRPDVNGRRDILKVHLREMKVEDDVDLDVLARRTPGFVGADLANLVNEAALLTARRDKEKLGMPEFEEAIDRVLAGPERKSRIISKKEREIIAYHESGHALVASKIKGADPVHKISIIPRGHMALGYTLQLPEEDRFLISRQELSDKITVLLGGRVAEMIRFGDVTTGASNDLERATQIARQMVTQYGMSDKLGLVTLGRKQHEVFLGHDIVDDRNYSEEVAHTIDLEIRAIVDGAMNKAKGILTENRERLEEITKLLLEKEMLEGDELDELLGYPKREHAEEKPQEEEKPGNKDENGEDKKDGEEKDEEPEDSVVGEETMSLSPNLEDGADNGKLNAPLDDGDEEKK